MKADEKAQIEDAAQRLAEFYSQLSSLLDRGEGASHSELLALAIQTVFAKRALTHVKDSDAVIEETE